MGDLTWTYPDPDDIGDYAYVREAGYQYYDGRLLAVQDAGLIVRAVMPVVLDTGQAASFGVWVGINDEDRWVYPRFDDDWGGFTFRGFLVNAPEPWPEVFMAPVILEATSGPELARVISTEHEVLQRVLSGENRVRPPNSSQ